MEKLQHLNMHDSSASKHVWTRNLQIESQTFINPQISIPPILTVDLKLNKDQVQIPRSRPNWTSLHPIEHRCRKFPYGAWFWSYSLVSPAPSIKRLHRTETREMEDTKGERRWQQGWVSSGGIENPKHEHLNGGTNRDRNPNRID